LIIHRGKYTSYDPKDPALYQIRGVDISVRAIQTRLKAANLNTYNTFVLRSGKIYYVWYGKTSQPDERKFATNNTALKDLNYEICEIEEGKETNEFWSCLQGEPKYPLKCLDTQRTSRLFQCSVATGVFEVHEVYNFLSR